jgi:hypothetical protein
MRTRSLDGAHCEYLRSAPCFFSCSVVLRSVSLCTRSLFDFLRRSGEFQTPLPSSSTRLYLHHRCHHSYSNCAPRLLVMRCFLLSYVYAVMDTVTSGRLCQVPVVMHLLAPAYINFVCGDAMQVTSELQLTQVCIQPFFSCTCLCTRSYCHHVSLCQPGVTVVWVVDPMHGNTVLFAYRFVFWHYCMTLFQDCM